MGDLDLLEEGECLLLGELDTVDEDSRVDSLTEISFGLSHQLSNEENVGGGAVTDDVVLSSSSTANHSGSRVLNLLFELVNAVNLYLLPFRGGEHCRPW